MSPERPYTGQAEELMRGFAVRTGLEGPGLARRYLWTDAFAVCNLLGLAETLGDPGLAVLARRLIDQVHGTLGRHRGDDPRGGWISGLGEEAGRAHPTAGGLRIGKPLPERGESEPFDSRLEWERDGQYFHYLARWMHALDTAARRTGDPRYAAWGCELAGAAAAFVRRDEGGSLGMHWKMSIDLSRPLVASTGQHDPLEGWVTALRLAETSGILAGAGARGTKEACASLGRLADVYASIAGDVELSTTDALGLGGLLSAAAHLAQLIGRGVSGRRELLPELLHAAEYGIYRWSRSGALDRPAAGRLAFRELGLAIGLEGVRWMLERVTEEGTRPFNGNDLRQHLESLGAYLPLGRRIVTFWLDPESRRSPGWREHEDINDVMLATALEPDGYLLIPAPLIAAGTRREGGGA